jgi:dTDP-glucose pyrophosphorylase
MKIIIPMAGAGSRFKKIGIRKPKYEIIANGKSLFHWSMKSLTDFFDCEFFFIYRGDKKQENFIKSECEKIGISNFKTLHIEELTDGQASTVIKCDGLISPNTPICIYNIDTYVEPYSILKKDINKNSSGFIPAFKASGNRWSFIKVNTKTQEVVEVSEKIPISKYATIGFYYFDQWLTFKRLYSEYRNDIIKNFNETYIAPMYNYLIRENKKVTFSIIPSQKVHVLGTPEDLKKFSPNFLFENK